MKNYKSLNITLFLFLIINLIVNNTLVFAVEPKHPNNQDQYYQYNVNIIERLARIEEGQKAIISEMNVRFEAVLKEMQTRFEAVDKRFEAVDKRFEALISEMNARFEAVDKRFETLIREMNARFEGVDKRIDQLGTYFMAIIGTFVSIFLAMIGFAIWDRKTMLVKAREESEKLYNNLQQEERLNIKRNNEKIQQLIDIMKKMSEKIPEMKNMMQTANLL